MCAKRIHGAANHCHRHALRLRFGDADCLRIPKVRRCITTDRFDGELRSSFNFELRLSGKFWRHSDKGGSGIEQEITWRTVNDHSVAYLPRARLKLPNAKPLPSRSRIAHRNYLSEHIQR